MLRVIGKGVFFASFTLLLISCSGEEVEETETTETAVNVENSDESEAETETTDGGELRVAYSSQPETLDPRLTTASATRDTVRSVYESLVTLNSNHEVTPMLAQSYEENDDGTAITFHLREGVLFHNGEEMTADDVVASMEQWSELTGILEDTTYIAEDDYTVVLELEDRNSMAMFELADISQMAAVMPEEVIENAEATGVTEVIGTGPYEFEEWLQDQHIHLTKFEDYQGVSEPADGMAGEKAAYLEDIYFEFVSDASTRISGLQTGEYDIAPQVPWDSVEQLEGMDGIEIKPAPAGMAALIFNKQEGFFTDETARQAVNAALDNEAMMTAAFSSEDYFDMEPGLMLPDQVDWYTDAGAEFYNQNDSALAEELLEEAGYDGEEVRILTSRDYQQLYDISVVAQQQLEEIGLNVELDVVEWAALLEYRDDPGAYEIFVSSFHLYSIPHQYPLLDSNWPGWTDHPEYDRLFNEMNLTETQDEARELLAELQEVFYEDVPVANVGHYQNITGLQSYVEGHDDLMGPILWNVTVND